MTDKAISAMFGLSAHALASSSLLTALLVDLVRRNILAPEDARNIIANAIETIEGPSLSEATPEKAREIRAQASGLLATLLELPIIKGTE